MIILEENFKWHLKAFASELFIYIYILSVCHTVFIQIKLTAIWQIPSWCMVKINWPYTWCILKINVRKVVFKINIIIIWPISSSKQTSSCFAGQVCDYFGLLASQSVIKVLCSWTTDWFPLPDEFSASYPIVPWETTLSSAVKCIKRFL